MSTTIEAPVKTQEGIYLAKPNSIAVIRVDEQEGSRRNRDGNRDEYTEVIATLYMSGNVNQDLQDKLDDADSDLVLSEQVDDIMNEDGDQDIEASVEAVSKAAEKLVKQMMTDVSLIRFLADARFVKVIYESGVTETYVRTASGFELETA